MSNKSGEKEAPIGVGFWHCRRRSFGATWPFLWRSHSVNCEKVPVAPNCTTYCQLASPLSRLTAVGARKVRAQFAKPVYPCCVRAARLMKGTLGGSASQCVLDIRCSSQRLWRDVVAQSASRSALDKLRLSLQSVPPTKTYKTSRISKRARSTNAEGYAKPSCSV